MDALSGEEAMSRLQGIARLDILKPALALGLVLTLTGLAGCSSAPGGTGSQRASGLPATTAAAAPTERYLATLILDAGSALLYAEPSTSSPVVATLSSGEELSLIQRTAEWLQVRATSGVSGFLQPDALVASDCVADRAEPRLLEVPTFAFREREPRGIVVIEAEFDANARILSTRVLESPLGDPALEQEALADLQRIRFLPPTKDCKPQPFFYTFTRQF
jgi:Bacterial SH3 domain